MGRSRRRLLNPGTLLYFPCSNMPGLHLSASDYAIPFFVSTTVTGAQVGVTNLAVGSTTGLAVGQVVTIGGGIGDKTILTIPDATHITFSGAVTTVGGESVVVKANSSQYAMFRRLVAPVNGFIRGYSLDMNGLLTGTGATLDINGGIFSCNNDVYLSPNDVIPGCDQGILQLTSAGMVGFSSRHANRCLFSSSTNGWVARGTPLWWGGLWQLSGTITAGGLNGALLFEPRALLAGNAAYRGNLRSTAVRAYSAATLAGLVAAITGGAFPSGMTANVAGTANQDFLSNATITLIMEETD